MNINYPSETIKAINNLLFIGEEIDSLPKSDLVIVFGSEFIKGSVDALELLLSHKIIDYNTKIILSGATGTINAGKESEAKRMYEEAIKRNLPDSMFFVEDKATNSYQNLEFSKKIIESIGGFSKFNSLLFVGKSFMLRRTKMGAVGLDYPMEKIHYYGLVDKEGRNIAPDCWWEQEQSRIRVLQEIERIGKYAAKGDLSIF